MKKPNTTRARLALYRQRAADNKHGRNDWRAHKYGNTWATDYLTRSEDGRKIYADGRDALGDYVGDWENLLSSRATDATGFYADGYCSDVIKGGAEKVRTSRGTYYVPVTYCTGWDGVTYYWADAEIVPKGADEDDHDEAAKAAARSAYYYAEREAEDAREFYAKEQAETDIAEARDEIHKINRRVLALLAEIRGNQYTPNVCEALRQSVARFISERGRQFAIIKARTDNYWSAVPY